MIFYWCDCHLSILMSWIYRTLASLSVCMQLNCVGGNAGCAYARQPRVVQCLDKGNQHVSVYPARQQLPHLYHSPSLCVMIFLCMSVCVSVYVYVFLSVFPRLSVSAYVCLSAYISYVQWSFV